MSLTLTLSLTMECAMAKSKSKSAKKSSKSAKAIQRTNLSPRELTLKDEWSKSCEKNGVMTRRAAFYAGIAVGERLAKSNGASPKASKPKASKPRGTRAAPAGEPEQERNQEPALASA